MRYTIILPIIAGLSVGVYAAMASAEEQPANLSRCVKMAGQVKTALEEHTQASGYNDAVKQQGYGLEFCNQGFYTNGVEHYNQALKLLSAGKTGKI